MLGIIQGVFYGVAHVINSDRKGCVQISNERELGIMDDRLRGVDFIKEKPFLKPKLNQMLQAV